MTEKSNQISNNHNTTNDGKKEEARKAMPVKRIPKELKKPTKPRPKKKIKTRPARADFQIGVLRSRKNL